MIDYIINQFPGNEVKTLLVVIGCVWFFVCTTAALIKAQFESLFVTFSMFLASCISGVCLGQSLVSLVFLVYMVLAR